MDTVTLVGTLTAFPVQVGRLVYQLEQLAGAPHVWAVAAPRGGTLGQLTQQPAVFGSVWATGFADEVYLRPAEAVAAMLPRWTPRPFWVECSACGGDGCDCANEHAVCATCDGEGEEEREMTVVDYVAEAEAHDWPDLAWQDARWAEEQHKRALRAATFRARQEALAL